MASGFRCSEHPVYAVPGEAEFRRDPEGVAKYLAAREERIRLEREEPYYYGYRPAVWGKVDALIGAGKTEVLILGGNRASKSEYGGYSVVRMLMSGEGKRVWCLQATEPNSVEMQQPIVWRYLPPEFKNLKKGKVQNISYSQKNGFSENKFVTPAGCECIFRNYSQDISVIEGGECDLIWADELIPLGWIETIRYRLITRGGLLLLTFTPVEGYSQSVKEYLDGARVIETEAAPLLGGTLLPRVSQCVRQSAAVVYYWTSDNAFGNYPNLVKTLEGAPRSEILTRAYGVPTKAIAARFPSFRERLHVVAEVPLVGSNYLFCDPASSRNWFLVWVRVDPRGRHYVYREWPSEGSYIPDVGDPGVWAEPDGRRADGKAGSAQASFGWGLLRYIEEIRRLEVDDGEIIERWMDSRFGNSPSTQADSATTLLEECANYGMAFSPAPADPIEEGVSLINSMLDSGREGQPEPLLYIHERCKAVIFGLKVWTGKDERHGACKDPVDCLRWMAVAGLEDAEEGLQLIEPRGY